jgi:hypothetical protein
LASNKAKVTGFWSLLGAAVVAIAGIATNSSNASVVVVLIVVLGIIVIALIGLYRAMHPAPRETRPVTLSPDRLSKSLSADQRQYVNLLLSSATLEAANALGIGQEGIRSNLFCKDPKTEQLRMVKNLHCHMTWKPEWSVKIRIGRGCTGVAYQSGSVNRAIWKDGWGPNDIGDDAELAKVHPDLRWILSFPVYSHEHTDPALVMNVDGLRKRVTLQQLDETVGHLLRYPQLLQANLNLGA